MDKKLFFFHIVTFFSLIYFPIVQAQPQLATTLPPPVATSAQGPQIDVVDLDVGKPDPSSMFGNSPYVDFSTIIGTKVVLLIHTNSPILSLDQPNTQLLSFTDNLGTDMIAAGKQQKIDWQASHPNVTSSNDVTENGIDFKDSKVMNDGNGVLLIIKSLGFAKPEAVKLRIKGNLGLILSDNSQPVSVASQPNVNFDGNDVSFTVNKQPVSLKMRSSNVSIHGDQTFSYKVDSLLAVTKIEAFSADGKTLLDSVMIVPGQDSLLKIASTAKLVNLKIYYNAQAKKLIIPIDISTGVGI